MKKAIILSIALVVCSCTNNTKEDMVNTTTSNNSQPTLGKYVYFHFAPRCLHTKQKCTGIIMSEGATRCNSYVTERKLANQVTMEDLKYCCCYCVNDSIYEELLKIASRK